MYLVAVIKCLSDMFYFRDTRKRRQSLESSEDKGKVDHGDDVAKKTLVETKKTVWSRGRAKN